MLVMVEYTFTFKMVNKAKNSVSERVAGLTLPLSQMDDRAHLMNSFFCINGWFSFGCKEAPLNEKMIYNSSYPGAVTSIRRWRLTDSSITLQSNVGMRGSSDIIRLLWIVHFWPKRTSLGMINILISILISNFFFK